MVRARIKRDSETTESATGWWIAQARALDSALQRYMRRSLSVEDSRDAAAAVHMSLVQQARHGLSDSHPAWLRNEPPTQCDIAEFERHFWRLARLRRLDALRRNYVLRQFGPLDREPVAPDGIARLEARDFLRRLAQLMETLPESDRALLLAAADSSQGVAGGLTNAEKIRVHRLRRMMAKRLWSNLRHEDKLA